MLKVAVAGCGLIAVKNHIPAFLRLNNKIRVSALCDLNTEAMKKAADKFRIRNTYPDFAEMLDRESPDIVDICTPPQTHAGLAIQALEKGAHVFLEKPMALKTTECDLMIEAASRQKRQIRVMHNQLFNPAFMEARKRVESGEIGDFLAINICILTPVDYITSKKEHWAHRLPGGVLGESGPHGVYLALAFLKDIYDIDARAKKILPQYPWSKFEDFRINLFAGNGAGSIIFNYVANQWMADIVIMGTKGALKVDLETQSVIKHDRRSLGRIGLGLSLSKDAFASLNNLTRNGLRFIRGRALPAHFIGIEEFVRNILEGGEPGVSAQDARETVRIMEAITEKLKCAE